MLHLKLTNIKYIYPNSNQEVLNNLNLEFTNGYYAIVGANGSGKSTILKLINKSIKPQSGTIVGNDLVYYCKQSSDESIEDFEEFIYDYTTYKIRDSLQIKDEWLYRYDTLSYGEKKRIQLAIALHSSSDILLLDEPTNHLDIKSKEILIKTLKSFKGITIIVSHDRYFLNQLCQNTIFLKNQKAFIYKTNYSNAMDEYQKELNNIYKNHQKQKSEIKKLETNIKIQKQKVEKSKTRLSKKGVDIKDKDKKEKINLAKLTNKDKNDSKLINSLYSKIKQVSSNKIDITKEYNKGINIKENLKYNSIFPIHINTNLTINKGDKIAITGENGSGKTTLIKKIVNLLDKKDVLYIPQEIDIKLSKELLESIKALSNTKKGELLTIITRLSSNPKNILTNSNLSYGELKKLLLAKALLEEKSIIILDEPTNHLDIDSIISIENALKSYQGTIILISHDKEFIKNTTQIEYKVDITN
jgi:ATPase subunit of ABC transporter with duplicated ATPase domains